MPSEKAKEYADTIMPVTVKYADYEICEYTEEQLQEAFDAGAEKGANEFAAKLLEVLGEELDKDNYLLVKTVIENLGVENGL